MVVRWASRLAGVLIVAMTASCATAYWMAAKPPPPTSLTVNLSGSRRDVSSEFDRRVKARFPIGSTVSEMGASLHRQGFSRQDWSSSVEREHVAIRREDNFVCKQIAYVYWHDDGENHLTSIRGVYRDEGCL